MKKIRRLSLIALIGIMLFFTQTTLAYWASDISGNSENTQAIVSIGTWDFDDGIPEWVSDPDEPYEEGDIVEYNGNLYIRNSRGGSNAGSLFPPDSFLGWIFWDPTN